MDYIVVGLNHKTAPVSLREKLAFAPETLAEALHGLVAQESVEEGLILSTCNRVEIYAATQNVEQGFQAVRGFLSHQHRLDPHALFPHLYTYQAKKAVHHGFRVASSLDSMVVGETQITGQIRKAYEEAITSKTAGSWMHRFMQRAIQVARRVRNETLLSSSITSVGTASVKLAAHIFGSLENKKVVILGAGKIGTTVLNALQTGGVKEIQIVNRSQKEISGVLISSLDSLDEALIHTDMLISSVTAAEVLLDVHQTTEIMKKRRYAPLFLVDLGVPRNIDPKVNQINHVYLYNIDDLQSVVEENRMLYQEETNKAEKIVEQEASVFYEAIHLREPTIAQLSQKLDWIRTRELEKTLKRLSHLNSNDKLAIEKLSQAIVSRILHDPILTLRTDEIPETDWDTARLLKKIFRLEDN